MRRRSLLFPIFLDAVSDAYSSSFLAFLLLVRLMLQNNIFLFFAGGGEGFQQFSNEHGCNGVSGKTFFLFDICGEFLSSGIDVHLGQLAAFFATLVMMAGNTKWNSVVWLWFSAVLSLCKSAVYIVLLLRVKDGYAYSKHAAGAMTMSHSPFKVLAAMAPLQTLILFFFIALLLEEYRVILKSWRQFMKSVPRIVFVWSRSRILNLCEWCGWSRRRHTETQGELEWSRREWMVAPDRTAAVDLGNSNPEDDSNRDAEAAELPEESERNKRAPDMSRMQSTSDLIGDISSSLHPSPLVENRSEQAYESLLSFAGTV